MTGKVGEMPDVNSARCAETKPTNVTSISRTEAMHRLVSEWEQSRAEHATSGENISGGLTLDILTQMAGK
jgi:hypothetical protein